MKLERDGRKKGEEGIGKKIKKCEDYRKKRGDAESPPYF
jgi:hypothetical protein